MSSLFLTRKELARMVYNQHDNGEIPEEILERVANKLAKNEYKLIIAIEKSGFKVENFGYNRYLIK